LAGLIVVVQAINAAWVILPSARETFGASLIAACAGLLIVAGLWLLISDFTTGRRHRWGRNVATDREALA
jgi:hypothetical protein